MKKLNRIFIYLLSVLILLSANLTVYASDNSENSQKQGSLHLTLKDNENGNFIPGAKVGVYRVGLVSDNHRSFTLTDDFSKCEASLDNLNDSEIAEKLAQYAVENNIKGDFAVTDSKGNIRFENKEKGLYLAVQLGSIDGYTDFNPFFISIPQKSGNQWVYDVNAVPKTGMVRLIDISAKKIWNDDGDNRPKSVTLRLYKNEKAFDTVVLNSQNNWKHTWNNLPSDEEWSVREINIPKGYTVSYRENNYNYTIINSSALAHTGQLNWPIPVLGISGVLLFAAGWVVYSKQRKNYNG